MKTHRRPEAKADMVDIAYYLASESGNPELSDRFFQAVDNEPSASYRVDAA